MEFVVTGQNKVIIAENEAKAVKWYSDGKSVVEIGQELGISPRTVEAIFSRLRERTGCVNSVNLVATFLRNGIIQ